MGVERDFKYVFLVTVDCLRADAVGCIGGGNLTPNIDKLAEDAIVFRKAFANGPGTNQSFPAILTSTYFLMQGGFHLRKAYVTLAEVMRRNGFRTAAFHSNPFLSRFFGWNRGFEEFYDFIEETKKPSAAVTRGGFTEGLLKRLAKGLGIGYSSRFQGLMKKMYYWFNDYQIPYVEAKRLNQHTIGWITEHRNEKFFLWMHFMDAHPPLIPPAEYLSHFNTRKEAMNFNIHVNTERPSAEQLEILKDLYSGEVRYTDECIGGFIAFLQERKILQESLIVLLADHGQAFMEHNKFGHGPSFLYNEVLHVPLLIYGSGHAKKVDFPVQLLDVPPTILHVHGIEKPRGFLGNSLLPTAGDGKNVKPIFSESAKPDLINLEYDCSKKVISCIGERWKLIINELWGTTELYNLHSDFAEKKNLVENEMDLVKDMAELIQNHLSVEKSRRVGSFA